MINTSQINNNYSNNGNEIKVAQPSEPKRIKATLLFPDQTENYFQIHENKLLPFTVEKFNEVILTSITKIGGFPKVRRPEELTILDNEGFMILENADVKDLFDKERAVQISLKPSPSSIFGRGMKLATFILFFCFVWKGIELWYQKKI